MAEFLTLQHLGQEKILQQICAKSNNRNTTSTNSAAPAPQTISYSEAFHTATTVDNEIT